MIWSRDAYVSAELSCLEAQGPGLLYILPRPPSGCKFRACVTSSKSQRESQRETQLGPINPQHPQWEGNETLSPGGVSGWQTTVATTQKGRNVPEITRSKG